jgi:hypothetical protein
VQVHLEKLRMQAPSAKRSGTGPRINKTKRELFAKLAQHFEVPAAEVERAMKTTRPYSEMAIVQDVPGFAGKLHGSRLYVPAMVALFTGMRLGEVVGAGSSRPQAAGSAQCA